MSKITEKTYETGFHISPSLSESEYKKLFDMVMDCVKKTGADVMSSQEPEHMELAYEVKNKNRAQDGTYVRFNESYFASIKFRSARDVILGIKEFLSEQKDVFRFLLWESIEGDTRYEVPTEDLPKEMQNDSKKIQKQEEQENKAGMSNDDIIEPESNDDKEGNDDNDDKEGNGDNEDKEEVQKES